MTQHELEYALEIEGLVEAEKPRPDKFLLQIYQALIMIPKDKLPNLENAIRLIQIAVKGSEFNLRFVQEGVPKRDSVMKLDNPLEIRDWILHFALVRADDGGLDLQVEAKPIT